MLLISILLVYNMLLKKLNYLLIVIIIIKILKQIFSEYKHMIQQCADIFVLDLLTLS